MEERTKAGDHGAVDTDSILNYIGYGPLQALAFALAGLTSLAFGLEMVLFAYLDIPLQAQWNISSVQYAALPAMTGVGNILGGVLYGFLCDHYGRVWPYALILAHIGVVGLASALSETFLALVLLRTFVSVAVTGASTVMFSTLVEFLPVRNRGKIMVTVLLIESVGICMMAGLSWWLITAYPTNGWRYVLVAAAIPYFIPAAYRLLFHIQSPRFLLAKGRYKDAEAVFNKMACINGRAPVPHALLNIRPTVENSKERSTKTLLLAVLSMFKLPYLRTTVCLSIIFVTETASYFSASAFLPLVLKNFGLDPYLVSFMGYLGQIPGILLMAIIVEWRGMGRLNSLRIFTFMTASALTLLAVAAVVRNQPAIAVCVVLVYFSMVPVMSLLYVYISEIYPTEIRTIALGFFNNLSAAFGLVLPYFSGYLAGLRQHWVFPAVWAVVFLVQLLFSLCLNVETLGQNLADKASKT